MTDKELIQRWKSEVYDRAEQVDPDNSYTWMGLAVGFFMGAGKTIEEAEELASQASDLNLV